MMADALNLDPAAVAREAVASAYASHSSGRTVTIASIRAGKCDGLLTVQAAILGATAMREKIAAEIARRLNAHDEMLAALRRASTSSKILPPMSNELYEFYPAMSASAHEHEVVVYVRSVLKHMLAAAEAAVAEGRADG